MLHLLASISSKYTEGPQHTEYTQNPLGEEGEEVLLQAEGDLLEANHVDEDLGTLLRSRVGEQRFSVLMQMYRYFEEIITRGVYTSQTGLAQAYMPLGALPGADGGMAVGGMMSSMMGYSGGGSDDGSGAFAAGIDLGQARSGHSTPDSSFGSGSALLQPALDPSLDGRISAGSSPPPPGSGLSLSRSSSFTQLGTMGTQLGQMIQVTSRSTTCPIPPDHDLTV
jgi:hypothetical protein